MTDQASDPMDAGRKKGRSTSWRWLKRAVVVLTALCALTLSVFYGLSKSVAGRWERYAAELRAAGEPLTFAQIEALRTTVPDERNGASVIENAIAMLRDIEEPGTENVFILDSDCEADFFAGISEECIEPSRHYVAARRSVLDELSRLQDYPEVSFDIPYETQTLGGPALFELLSGIRNVGKLAHAAAIVETIEGEETALDKHIEEFLRLSEGLGEEPHLLARLVQMAMDAIAARMAEGLLSFRELDETQLVPLQREWERQASLRTMRWALLGERALEIGMTNEQFMRAAIEPGGLPVPGPAGAGPNLPNPVDWIPFVREWFLLENRIQTVIRLTKLVDASDSPAELLVIAKEQAASVGRYHPGKIFARILLPSLERAIELHVRSLGLFRCGLVALAAERMRLELGRFPDSLDELVPDYLHEVPADPVDGQPLRFTVREEGVVIYTIGEDGIDDGGTVAPAEPGPRRDFGFRLLHPDRRKLKLRPPALPEED